MLSVAMIALACLLIAVGRWRIRRARRERLTGKRWALYRRVISWGLVAAGFVLMILGVVLWDLVAR